MKALLARAAYALLLRLATPVYFARLWWRGRHEPLYRAAWNERLGGFDGAPGTGRLWLHAVSLGETRAAEPLVAALRAQRPGLRLLLTHGTATGREAGTALLQDGDLQVWLPYDTPGAVRRFLRRHRPLAGVVMETEVWPALLAAAQRERVPVVLANARLSDKSLAQGRRFAALLRPAAAAFTRVLAQTADDAGRLRAAGAGDVRVFGNLKFDMTPAPALLARGRDWRAALRRPVVLAAATREGEEAPLLVAWSALPAPRPLLLLVPRHPQRFDDVAALVATHGHTLARRSTWGDTPPDNVATADVWLGDSMREMPLYYAAADVALLGGSFAPLGGQNLIEAAACGCPLLMGPHTFNFAQAAELALAAGAARRVDDITAGVQQAATLAVTPAGAAECSAMAERALAFAAQHRGAAARMAREIVALLPPE
ncbi:3-deoxy-D-manno-octulosonic acid transferase [Rubrivivax sp. RP6-9]|uniref:3-deoxy-D-manno-octulosonic acid transferase n=1 Tax=Rubrivivax sp. RP6-9 TaxID=3415750 RepID=UPI003CC59D95